MAALDEFELLLKEVVQSKRLSASKMAKLTEIAMKSMQEDTQLVSVLYRTHKSLAPATKVSSLYVFDALARAARSHANKHNLTADANTQHGNAASFLVKIEGVLDGLIQDMASADIAEAKEKTKKILDIWVKGTTFPMPVLSRLKEMLNESKEPPRIQDPRPTTTTTTTTTAPQPAPPPPSQPQPKHPPVIPVALQQPAASPPLPTQDPQATLLALLSRAVASNPAALAQTQPNSTEPNAHHATQLSILQQLAQTAKLTTDNGFPQPPAGPLPKNGNYPPYQAPSYPAAAENPNRYDQRRQQQQQYDDRSTRPPRGSFRGGNRGRGRGRGHDGWREDRGGGGGGDRFRDRDEWSPRQRSSRSRSPPLRPKPAIAGTAVVVPPQRREVKPPFSPPRRPIAVYEGDVDKDEFGRDRRPQSTPEQEEVHQAQQPPPPPPPQLPTTVPASVMGNVETTTTPSSNPPLSTSIAANTSSMSPAAVAVAAAAASTNDASPPQGLESFNIAAFDFSTPSSWDALGKMWQVTNGETPSTEQLMQFVMSSAAAGQQQQQQQWTGGWDNNANSWENNTNQAYQGGGGGGQRRRGGGGGPGASRGHWNNYDARQETDAIVLGGGSDHDQQIDIQPDIPLQQSSAGSMQRVGDRWMFVRDPAG